MKSQKEEMRNNGGLINDINLPTEKLPFGMKNAATIRPMNKITFINQNLCINRIQ